MRLRWPWVLLIAILPLFGWWTYGLFDLDEGFYAAVASEMNRRGEWITPYYNGKPWFEKPILLYWLAKPAIALFGEMVGPRLPSILATAGTILLIGFYLRKRHSVEAGNWAALVYGTGLLVVATGRMMLTDPLLVLCLTGAFLTFWESLVGDRRWRVASAGLLGLGVLAKGPVAGLLFVLVVGIAFWRQPELRWASRGGWLAGTAVFAIVVSSWYVPAYLANGQLFVQKFLIEQNLGRFTGGDQAHTLGPEGLLVYPAVLLVGMLPWSIRMLRRRTETPGGKAFEQYLWTWFLVVFGFFSISGAKLPHYILPAIPPLAMLIALRLPKREPGWGSLAWTLGIWAFAQFGFSLYYYGGFGLPGFHAEVHRLARYVRENAKPEDTVALYQLSRRDRALGTGKPKIQETSHPSLMLYLGRSTVDTDEMDRILEQPRPVWIITRWNRIEGMKRVETPFEQNLYALYRID
ncbi:MAG TPA: glycosyltransferase family 39 protein [Fimbriimonas sp.]